MKIFNILLCSAALLVIKPMVGSAQMYATNVPINETATPEQQRDNAVQAINSVSLGQADSAGGAALGTLTSGRTQSKGFQLKDPIVTPGFSYRWMDDTSVGGFGGSEYSGSMSFDADIYDGLIAGVLYQHTYRGGSNALGTSENLDSNAVSAYVAKRFIDLINVGLSYNYGSTEHRLTRAITSNLDRDSNGVSMFAGLSDHKKNWSWSTTASCAWVRDDYAQQRTLDTGRFGLGGTLGYDITKEFTLGAGATYYYLFQQDTFGGAPRDNDYVNIGPRFTFYPLKDVAVRLDMDSMQGYTDVTSYNIRAAVDIGF